MNYDIYNNPINTSIEPDYGYNNYYDGNDGQAMYGIPDKYNDPDRYNQNYAVEPNLGVRKRNINPNT